MTSIEIDQLKVGDFLWWAGDTGYNAWNCPVQVLEVGHNMLRVRALDDFGAFELKKYENFCAASPLRNMRIASKDEVRAFLEEQERTLQAREASLAAERRYFDARKGEVI